MKKAVQYLSIIVVILLGITSAKAQTPEHYVLYTGGNNVIPFNFSSNKAQWLYYPSEFTNTVPLTAGMISKVYIRAASSVTNANIPDITIGFTMTNLTTLTSGTWHPITTVYYQAAYSQTAVVNDWTEYVLQTPFFYDGTSNLIFSVSTSQTNAGGITVYQGDPSGMTTNRRMYGLVAGAASAGADWTQVSMGFDMISKDNAGISELVEPQSNDLCAGIHQVKVRVINGGSNDIDSVRVNWTLNGVPQPTFFYNGNIPDITNTNNSVVVTLGSVNFPHNVPMAIKAWTSFPNGELDLDNTNDTLNALVTATMQGITLNDMVDTALCNGDSLVLDAGYSANTDYTWSNGRQAQVNIITQPGTYWVWAYNPTGCQAFDTFNVTLVPEPMAGPYVVGIDNGAGNFTFNIPQAAHIDVWEWDFGDNSPVVFGAAPITHTYTQAGSYLVKVKLSNSCGYITRYGNIFTSGSNIKEIEAIANAIELYPSPASNVVTLHNKSDKFTIKEINIFNTIGQRVFSADVKDQKSMIDVSNFATGLYNIQVITDKGNVNKKFEVVR